MNIFILVWSYIKARPLNTAINIVLLSLGIAVITVLLLLNKQLQKRMNDNSRGIDLVVGAKGSPLQLILCNVFHVDFPTGNISLQEADRISRNRLVSTAIPLALGDSYRSYRIVGTVLKYPEMYQATIEDGTWWKEDLEVTIGANVARTTGLRINDQFVSAHGLSDSPNAHDDHKYLVKGILRETGTVVDNLILTSVESIWRMHDESHVPRDTNPTDSLQRSRLVPTAASNDSLLQITSILIRYRSPLAAVQLPRIVNSQTGLQAASPAFELARLLTILGVGVDIVSMFAYLLIAISALSIFIALYNSLKERRYDMAVMRTMGASRLRLFNSVLLEGGILTFLGCCIGMGMGHGALVLLPAVFEEGKKAGLDGLIFYRAEWIILIGSLLLGLLCALIPAIQAYRSQISKVLSTA